MATANANVSWTVSSIRQERSDLCFQIHFLTLNSCWYPCSQLTI